MSKKMLQLHNVPLMCNIYLIGGCFTKTIGKVRIFQQTILSILTSILPPIHQVHHTQETSP